jgi:hypothetical protein
VTSQLLTAQDADDCVKDAARAYESMSYLQLRALSKTPEGRWLVADRTWRGVPIRLTIQVHHFGLLRPRASVEIVASAPGEKSWPWTPCVYLERFASGKLKLYRSSGDAGLVAMLLHVLMLLVGYLLLFVLVVSAVVIAVWGVLHLATGGSS